MFQTIEAIFLLAISRNYPQEEAIDILRARDSFSSSARNLYEFSSFLRCSLTI